MSDQYWSWLLSVVGVTGFLLAGRKIWWSWYINIACQFLWFTYAIVTEQWGFLFGGVIYAAVFVNNAYEWTMEHLRGKPTTSQPIGQVMETTVDDTGMTVVVRVDDPLVQERLTGDVMRHLSIWSGHE